MIRKPKKLYPAKCKKCGEYLGDFETKKKAKYVCHYHDVFMHGAKPKPDTFF